MVSDEPPHDPLPQVDARPTPQQFAAALRKLWEWTGLTLEGLRLPSSTSHDFLNGKRTPNASWLDAFVMRCLSYGKERRWLPAGFDIHAELDKWRLARAHIEQQRRSHKRAKVATDQREPVQSADGNMSTFANVMTFAGSIITGWKIGDLVNKAWDTRKKRR
ncbi:hypothetical protein [Amycolatopsis sp. CA-126428]|uniref:hypothetical protein n=1 Tax=Amycolatopsis sp. CA-126428 TaxID=2073158 RepID=UPI0011AFFDE1|nr:hypothetical protein [Amycolatopsis sp. CA-126428]